MANVAAWLLALVAPIAKRALIALGIGVVSYAGIDAALDAVRVAIASNIGGISGEISSFLAMAGFFTAIGIIFGGVMARVALMAVSKLGRVL